MFAQVVTVFGAFTLPLAYAWGPGSFGSLSGFLFWGIWGIVALVQIGDLAKDQVPAPKRAKAPCLVRFIGRATLIAGMVSLAMTDKWFAAALLVLCYLLVLVQQQAIQEARQHENESYWM